VKNKLLIFGGVFALLLFVSLTFVAGFTLGTTTATQEATLPDRLRLNPELDMPLAQEVLGHLIDDYVDNPNKAKLVDGAIDGMIDSLGDPYSRRLKETAYEDFQEHTSGEFGGVGMELAMKKKRITVVAPIKDTPASRAGIKAGDIITSIESTPTKNLDLDTAVKLIRGDIGTKIKLSFERENGKSFSRVLTRSQIKYPNVNGKILDKDLGYIMVHQFNRNTGVDIKKELDEQKNKGIKGVIIDLRNNPGGLLSEAVDVTGVFMSNEKVVKVKSRTGKSEMLFSGPGGDNDIPLVVVVNKGSASASEIFSGAVQDLDRGVIVGETTFGKGCVQTVIDLSDGSGLILTTAKYLTPKGRSLHKKGVKPDVAVKFTQKDFDKKVDPQINTAKETLRALIGGKKVADFR
jgi:carboxyl-terminal processing protease